MIGRANLFDQYLANNEFKLYVVKPDWTYGIRIEGDMIPFLGAP